MKSDIARPRKTIIKYDLLIIKTPVGINFAKFTR